MTGRWDQVCILYLAHLLVFSLFLMFSFSYYFDFTGNRRKDMEEYAGTQTGKYARTREGKGSQQQVLGLENACGAKWSRGQSLRGEAERVRAWRIVAVGTSAAGQTL